MCTLFIMHIAFTAYALLEKNNLFHRDWHYVKRNWAFCYRIESIFLLKWHEQQFNHFNYVDRHMFTNIIEQKLEEKKIIPTIYRSFSPWLTLPWLTLHYVRSVAYTKCHPQGNYIISYVMFLLFLTIHLLPKRLLNQSRALYLEDLVFKQSHLHSHNFGNLGYWKSVNL